LQSDIVPRSKAAANLKAAVFRQSDRLVWLPLEGASADASGQSQANFQMQTWHLTDSEHTLEVVPSVLLCSSIWQRATLLTLCSPKPLE